MTHKSLHLGRVIPSSTTSTFKSIPVRIYHIDRHISVWVSTWEVEGRLAVTDIGMAVHSELAATVPHTDMVRTMVKRMVWMSMHSEAPSELEWIGIAIDVWVSS